MGNLGSEVVNKNEHGGIALTLFYWHKKCFFKKVEGFTGANQNRLRYFNCTQRLDGLYGIKSDTPLVNFLHPLKIWF